MSWYKKAQNIIDTTEELYSRKGDGSDINYTDIGHGQSSNMPPNFLWVCHKGQIFVEQESENEDAHSEMFPDWFSTKRQYAGRYDGTTKQISIYKPWEKMYKLRDVPDIIFEMLRRRFPEAKEIYIYH